MSSCRSESWLAELPESLPFARLKPLALLENNKLDPQIVNYFSPSLE